MDLVLSPLAISVTGVLLTALVGTIVHLYRDVLKGRDLLLNEKNERIQDLQREKDEKEIKIVALWAMVERSHQLSVDATSVTRQLAEEARTRVP